MKNVPNLQKFAFIVILNLLYSKISDLVDALCIALPLRVCAVSLQYIITKWGKVNMGTIGTWPYNLA
jgi:hypothetical protein